MAISQDTIKHLAHLARLELKAEESQTLATQLKDILDFIDKLKQPDTAKTAPTSHILAINNVLREDNPGKSLDIAETLENAPQKDGDFFVVPKVIE
jgi:aspartyl-tRNA(Asn)/glutamyl-tRNA(Gln) amidotransferase subunit C